MRSLEGGSSQAWPAGPAGFPVSIDVGQNWPTDWQYTGLADDGAAQDRRFPEPEGSVSLFANPTAAQQDFATPFPGGSG
jgi:hypothetical protein